MKTFRITGHRLSISKLLDHADFSRGYSGFVEKCMGRTGPARGAVDGYDRTSRSGGVLSHKKSPSPRPCHDIFFCPRHVRGSPSGNSETSGWIKDWYRTAKEPTAICIEIQTEQKSRACCCLMVHLDCSPDFMAPLFDCRVTTVTRDLSACAQPKFHHSHTAISHHLFDPYP